jgi:hypothetical protein
VPFVALTADAMKQNSQADLAAGMNAVATKPLSLPQLLKALDNALGQKVYDPESETAGKTTAACRQVMTGGQRS